MTSSTLPVVRVTEIGEYIRHRSCERRFKLEFDHRKLATALPFAERLFNSLDPVLQEAGRERESNWEASLRSAGFLDLSQLAPRSATEKAISWSAFADALQRAPHRQNAYAREVAVRGLFGSFALEGRIDFVLLLWRGDQPYLRLVECKASRRDRTYHRIQVAVYRLLVRQLMYDVPLTLGGIPVNPTDVECVVARIDESTNQSQQIEALEALALEMEEADIKRLLAADGSLQHIVATDLDDLDFQLDEKCDGCVFNVHCLAESGRERRLELLSISPSVARALRCAGVRDLDALAELNLDSSAATTIRRDPGFSENLPHLQLRARARRATLLGGDANPDEHEVSALPNTPAGQLPAHTINGQRLVRIFLSVDYDYSENRVGALSAHITNSDGAIHTGFVRDTEGSWRPDPNVHERRPIPKVGDERQQYSVHPISGCDIVEFIPAEWTGQYDVDTGAEKQLIQGFFQKLVDAIAEVANAESVPIHFYVWSRTEIARLVEACSRVSSRLLSHLRELLGCRESLEQLLYSCLQDEVDSRYALGWTGRGLSVVTSLRWYGRIYHWRRRVSGGDTDLDHDFEQDIFDFKTNIELKADGNWAARPHEVEQKHKFEIRSRFFDGLSAPYWRAYWRALPSPDEVGLSRAVANAIRRYNRAARPGILRAYLTARVQALRWVEEGIRFKNSEIIKQAVVVAQLPSFDLGVASAAQASIDFLRLDQHVKVTDWIAQHLVPPAVRIPTGRTIPVRDVISDGKATLDCRMDLTGCDIDAETLRSRCSFATGAFVRLTPRAADPRRGQTFAQLTRGGKTCRIVGINWDSGAISLEAMFANAGRYMLQGGPAGSSGLQFDFATIDESVSDFVAGRVEDRLQSGQGTYMYAWFDPEVPVLPPLPAPANSQLVRLERLLSALSFYSGRPLAADQVRAVLDGLQTRVHLLQGPPGTGKTVTTAISVFARAMLTLSVGDIVLVAAHTHTAVNNLLERMDGLEDRFRSQAVAFGFSLPAISLTKVYSSAIEDPPGGSISSFSASPSVRFVNSQRQSAVLVIGGTTGAILKLAKELSQRRPFSGVPQGFQVPLLVVDEASMLVFPHFLALTTLVSNTGTVMLAGDHRQLAPIVAHDWEREDRPPAVLYQPFASAYQAVLNITANPNITAASASRSALSFTFRLPPLIRDLISRIYRLDAIELDGPHRPRGEGSTSGDVLSKVWAGETGLFLVLHDERQSRQSNEVEVSIIEQLLSSADRLADGSIAVMTPHRAQRSLLKLRLAAHSRSVDVIDTVERMQGGERPTVIVSATASDPSAIATNVEFILDLNRSNVAFSRAQDRLIVVCSNSILDHIPAELEHYESAMLWKSLRALCSHQIGEAVVHAHNVRILTPPVEILASL